MKKKISLLLCLMMTAIVCLTGCGKTQTTLEYDEAMIEQETEFLINYCQNVDSDTLAQWNDQNEFSKEYQFMMSGLKFTPDSFDGAVDSWQAGIKECGEYVGHGDYTFEAKDDELTVSVPAQFKDRDATIEFVFDKDLYLESMTVSAKFSLGEIMEKAGLNTLLGMGTVFAVLIFISFLISLFKYIPAIQNAFGKKKDEQKEETDKSIRREFSYKAFKRSFTLDEKIDVEKIDARYENGVLKLELPKKQASQAPTKEINIQ